MHLISNMLHWSCLVRISMLSLHISLYREQLHSYHQYSSLNVQLGVLHEIVLKRQSPQLRIYEWIERFFIAFNTKYFRVLVTLNIHKKLNKAMNSGRDFLCDANDYWKCFCFQNLQTSVMPRVKLTWYLSGNKILCYQRDGQYSQNKGVVKAHGEMHLHVEW